MHHRIIYRADGHASGCSSRCSGSGSTQLDLNTALYVVIGLVIVASGLALRGYSARRVS